MRAMTPVLRWLRFVTVAGLALALAGGRAPSALAQAAGYVEPANMTQLVAAAAKEGEVDLAAGAVYDGPEGAQIIQNAIDAKYHINLKVNFTLIAGGVQFEQQLMQEIQAGQPASSDIFFSVDTVTQAPYLQAVDWRKFVPDVPTNLMFYGNKAVGVYANLLGYDYNTKLIPPNDVPRSYSDLLEPQFKGRIATSPYQGSFLNFIGLPAVLGHQGMLDFTRKFMGQVSGVMTCGQIDRVVSGEFSIFGIDCGDYEVHKRQRKGEPIGMIYPKEGTVLTYVAPGISLTARHPNAARLFIAYLLTRDGQDLLWKIAAADDDKLPGSHYAVFVAGLRRQGVKIIEGQMLDVTHPELITYTRDISRIINQGR